MKSERALGHGMLDDADCLLHFKQLLAAEKDRDLPDVEDLCHAARDCFH